MELWIRSQDKEVLSKVNNLCYYTRKDVCDFINEDELNEDIQHVIWSPDGSILGYYATKERALEVLDEIQEAQLGNYHYRCPSNAKVSNDENTIVYEMPSK